MKEKLFSFFLCLFLFLFTAGFLYGAEENMQRNFWRSDFRTARKYAKEEGKLLLLFFTVSDSTTLNRQMIQMYRTGRSFLEKSASDYVLVHVDLPNAPDKLSMTRKRQNQHLRNRFSVNTFPAFVLADPSTPWGTLLYKKQGKISPDELLDVLNKRFASKIKTLRQNREKNTGNPVKNTSEKGKTK